MRKLENMDTDVQNAIKRMSDNDVQEIINCINSELPILKLNAIMFGTKFKIKKSEFVNALKNISTNSKITFFGVGLSKFALASLHLLKIQEYEGTDDTVNRFIKSDFDF